MLIDQSGLFMQVHGGAHEGGVAGLLSQLLTGLEGVLATSGGDGGSHGLPGIAAMANFHPLVVHFPIALLTCFFLVELGAFLFRQGTWRPLASGLLYLGTLSAALAVYFGLGAAETVPHGDDVHQIMESHEQIGFAVLGLALLLSVWRIVMDVQRSVLRQMSFLVFAGILAALLAFGADLGGLMVYHYGVAVTPQVSAAMPTGAEPAINKEHSHHHEHAAHQH